MSRAFHKAKLPLWYTEGFNPHVFLTFAAPLSLGFEGRRESMDIRLIEEMPYAELIEKLNAGLPRDIRVYAVTEPKMKGNDIANAEYVLRAETGDPAALQAALEGVLAQPELLVQKHTKKGERTVDIRPYFADMRFEPEDGLRAIRAASIRRCSSMRRKSCSAAPFRRASSGRGCSTAVSGNSNKRQNK